MSGLGLRFNVYGIFPSSFTGHGFLREDQIRDYTKRKRDPLCPPSRVPY